MGSSNSPNPHDREKSSAKHGERKNVPREWPKIDEEMEQVSTNVNSTGAFSHEKKPEMNTKTAEVLEISHEPPEHAAFPPELQELLEEVDRIGKKCMIVSLPMNFIDRSEGEHEIQTPKYDGKFDVGPNLNFLWRFLDTDYKTECRKVVIEGLILSPKYAGMKAENLKERQVRYFCKGSGICKDPFGRGCDFVVDIVLPMEQTERLYRILEENPQFLRCFFVEASMSVPHAKKIWESEYSPNFGKAVEEKYERFTFFTGVLGSEMEDVDAQYKKQKGDQWVIEDIPGKRSAEILQDERKRQKRLKRILREEQEEEQRRAQEGFLRRLVRKITGR